MTESKRLKMFNDNQALVPAFLKGKWFNKFVECEDLMQEGMLILWKCTDTYDPNRGVPFASYVYGQLLYGLSDYSNRWRFGTKTPSSYEESISAATYAYKNNLNIGDVCRERGLSPYLTYMANMITNGSSVFLSLDNYVGRQSAHEDKTLHEVIASDIDIEHDVCSKVYDEELYQMVHVDFIDWYIQNHGGLNPELNRKLLNEYVDILFGAERSILDVATKYKLTFDVTRVRFAKYRTFLRKWLVRNSVIERR